MRRYLLNAAIFVAGSAAIAAPALAQTPEALDSLVDATTTDEGTLAQARAQVDASDLNGAAATLERALLERPGASSDGIRVYYATVLCRLDDRRRAAYQLGNVRDPSMPGWEDARRGCGDLAVETAARAPQTTGEIAMGLAYDSDAFGALVNQFNLPATPANHDDGLAFVASARIDARSGDGSGNHFYGGAAFVTKNDISGPNRDYQVGALRAGYTAALGQGGSELSVGVVARHARLFGDPFVSEVGAQAAVAFGGGAGRWAVEAEAVKQDYRGGAIPSLRDGGRYDLALTYRGGSAPDRSWVAGIAFEMKDADLRFLGYRGGRVFAAMRTPISENGAYFDLSGTLRRIDHRNAPLIVDLKETRLFTRAAVGMPLGSQGLYAEGAVSYTGRWNNNASLLRDYGSVGAELRLVYRFGK